MLSYPFLNSRYSGQLFLFFVACACNMTEIKLYGVAIGFFIICSLLQFKLAKVGFFPFNKGITHLFFIFLLFLFISMLISNFKNPNLLPDIDNFLKQPYLISISRFIELTLCLLFVSLYGYLREFEEQKVIDYFVFGNLIFIFLYLLFFILNKIFGWSIFFYDNFTRLKGFNCEGGPLGLYFAFILSLCLYYKKYFCAFFCLPVIFLAKSKAGYVCVIFFTFFLLLSKILGLSHRSKSFFRFGSGKNIITIIMLSVFLITPILYFGKRYIHHILYYENYLPERNHDVITGRVSGVCIGIKMIKQNPLFGIGLGNYPLLRNQPEYRGDFPVIRTWDITGLGGLATLLVENGFLGLLAFLFVVRRLFYNNNENLEKKMFYFLLFLVPFALGTQLYFIYPWVSMLFFLSFSKKRRIPKSCRLASNTT